MEKPASKTMTRKIDSTTERVVSLPTLSALRSTRSPSKQPTNPMMKAKTGALIRPTNSVVAVDRALELAHEERKGDAEIEIAHHRPAEHAHDVGKEGEQRQADDKAQHARQHQHLGDVEAQRLHRVDFFVDAHGADRRR